MKRISLSSRCHFPIPFPDLTVSEIQALRTIHTTRQDQPHSFIGQVELSPRLTVMVLCYLLRQAATLTDGQSANYFMLVKTEERRKQLVQIADKLVPFVLKWITGQNQEFFCGSVRVYEGLESYNEHPIQFEGRREKKSGKLFILTSRTFLEQRVKAKEHEYWAKDELMDFSVHIDQEDHSYFNRLCKKIQFMLLQTNDIVGILEDVFCLHLGEAQIARAWVQSNKLHKFYHDRFDSKKLANLKPQILEKLKDRAKNRSLPSKDEKKWRIQEYDQVFNKLAQRRVGCLKRTQMRVYADRSQLKEFLECELLMHLQSASYLCSHLMAELHSAKYEDYLKTSEYLGYLEDTRDAGRHNNANRPCIKRSILKKLKRVLLKLTGMYPPEVRGRRVSTFYLQQVLNLFEKLVIWHQLFSKGDEEDRQSGFMLLRYMKEMNPTAKLDELSGGKVFKQQQIKLTTYDTHLLLELLQEGVKSNCIFQAHAYAKEYIQETARISLPEITEFDPVSAQQLEKNQMRGLIVHCTPNDEQLYINSYKLEQKEESLEPEQRKEAGQHYWQLIRTFGVMIFDICVCAQDGIVVYFPSREVMKDCRAEWEAKQNIYERIYHQKTIFEESQFEEVNRRNVQKYRKLCDMGRGAVYFLSAQSQMGKYQSFNGHYSRVVIFIGVPYPEISLQIVARFRHHGVKSHQKSKMHMLCFREAMVTVARCLSNCGNDSSRFKPVVFADNGFRSQKVMPKWFPLIKHGSLNSSTVVQAVGEYLKKSITGLTYKERVQTYLALLSRHAVSVKKVQSTVENQRNGNQIASQLVQHVVIVLCHMVRHKMSMREVILQQERSKISQRWSYHPEESVRYREQVKHQLEWNMAVEKNGQKKMEKIRLNLADFVFGSSPKIQKGKELLILNDFVHLTQRNNKFDTWQGKIVNQTMENTAKKIITQNAINSTSENKLVALVIDQFKKEDLLYSNMLDLGVSYYIEDRISAGQRLKIIEKQNETIFQIATERGELKIWMNTPPLLKSIREDEKGNYREWIEGIIDDDYTQEDSLTLY